MKRNYIDESGQEYPSSQGKAKPQHTPTPEGYKGLNHIHIQGIEEALQKFGFHDKAIADIVNAVNCHEELLAIVKALGESFNAGANQVYAEALAPHTDDETLKTWINKAIAKAEAQS